MNNILAGLLMIFTIINSIVVLQEKEMHPYKKLIYLITFIGIIITCKFLFN